MIVYCARPDEATAARVAPQLHARGFRRVRPPADGIDAWESDGLAVDAIAGNQQGGQGSSGTFASAAEPASRQAPR